MILKVYVIKICVENLNYNLSEKELNLSIAKFLFVSLFFWPFSEMRDKKVLPTKF